ncbi:MAG: polymerase sigma-E factor [Gemmataceae bacterium]|nr:polymerase sigma-E factor [Gemmataceae bacterium]
MVLSVGKILVTFPDGPPLEECVPSASPGDPLSSTVRTADAGGLGSVLGTLGPYVRVVVRGLCRGREVTGVNESDMVQEVMLQATRGLAGFRGATSAEFVGWVRRIAIRTTGHTLRGLTAGPGFDAEGAAEMPNDAPGPVQSAIRREQSANMARAIGRLPEEMQQVLLGRLVEGLDHAALAVRLGRTVGAVRMLYLRSLRRLKDLYRE